MSDFRIDKITNRDGSAGTQIAGISTFSGTSGIVIPGGPTEYRGGRGRGIVFGGGWPFKQTIDYITIATTGNAVDFGDMLTTGGQLGACASSTRAVHGGNATPGTTNYMGYITISTTGDAATFGDFSDENPLNNRQAGGNEIRGMFWGGGSPATTNRKYNSAINIASLGDSYDWGDLHNTTGSQRVSISSPTRSVICGWSAGQAPFETGRNLLEYVTISTYGSATDFGNVDQYPNAERSGSSNSTRGILAGNWNPGGTNVINYITIATTGNGTDFGDLLTASNQASSLSSPIRCLVNGLGGTNVIQYITITTTGNAVDFGDMTGTRQQSGSTSDCHGGIG